MIPRVSRAVVVFALLALGCTERPGPPPTFRDRDAEAPPPGLGSGTPRSGAPSTGGGGTTPPGDECRARLLVIFDRSGSMSEPWETDDGPEPRWRVAADALDAALAPLADRLEVGAILFPTPSMAPTGCGEVDPIETQMPFEGGAAFLTHWREAWESPVLGGSTPLDAAFDRADEALPVDDSITAVVVLTDGQPSCRGLVLAEEHAATWQSRGIATYAVGLPGAFGAGGVDAEDILNAIARAGGTDTYLPVDDPAALTEGLASIAGDALEQACP
jgi:hypothetical protein